MPRPLQLPFSVPPGGGVEVVPDEDPRLRKQPLFIEAKFLNPRDILDKFRDYLIWHSLSEGESSPEMMPPDSTGQIVQAIQALYQYNETHSSFIQGVESVTLLYPKCVEASVVRQLANCPDSLRIGGKAIHVSGAIRVTSLPVLQHCLNIERERHDLAMILNNPKEPTWVAVSSMNAPPVRIYTQEVVGTSKEESEHKAWEAVRNYFISTKRVSVENERRYPQGPNEFPDYSARLEGTEYVIEITSVPDRRKWTIRETDRDFEKRISEIAARPGEKREEVIEDLSRVLGRKNQALRKWRQTADGRPCMLVICNWSTYELGNQQFWNAQDASGFDCVLILEMDKGIIREIRW